MNLKSLTNEELDRQLFGWVRAEKKALNNVLSHIVEVDRRKLYLEFAYPNLRAYLEQRMGYDGGSAQRRIDAARLSQAVPSVIDDLHSGNLKLAQITVLQKSLREAKAKVISNEMKSGLVAAIKNKSVHETQFIIANALDIEIKPAPRITAQADESVRFEVSLTKSQWEKFTTMRELLSHAVPTGDWSEVLEYLSDKVIQQKTGRIMQRENPAPHAQSSIGKASSENKNQPHPKNQRPSMYLLRKQILKQDQCCQFRNSAGIVCGSRWNLQVDHIRPKWAGGKDIAENLRVLCGNHNRYLYRKQSGLRAI